MTNAAVLNSEIKEYMILVEKAMEKGHVEAAIKYQQIVDMLIDRLDALDKMLGV